MKRLNLKTALLTLILAVVLLSLTGCTNPLNTKVNDDNSADLSGLPTLVEEENANFKKHEEASGVSFSYPSSWKSVGTTSQPIYLNDAGNGTSINLVTGDMPSYLSFDGYIEASIVNIKAKMTINGDVDKEKVNLNGRLAYKLSYTTTSNNITMRITQLAIQEDGKVYILTLGCQESLYESEKDTLDQIMKTFKK